METFFQFVWENIICFLWTFIKDNYEAIIGITIIATFFMQLGIRRKDFKEKQEIVELQEIKEKLKNFYGPFKELRRESNDLYNLFALEEKDKKKKLGERFRTVDFKTTGGKFKNADQNILKQIQEITKQEQLLIEKYGWEVENTSISDLLGRFGSHIRVFLLATNDDLSGTDFSEYIKHYRYPLELDGAIESQINKLLERQYSLLHQKKNYHDTKTIGIVLPS